MGRPRKEIDWNVVEKKMECGSSAQEIISNFDINDDTFYRRFEQEYGHGFQSYKGKMHCVGKSKLREVQYEKALEGNTQMMTLLGREWLGQDKPIMDIPPLSDSVDKENKEMSENHRLRLENEELRKQLDNKSKTGSELFGVDPSF